MMVTRPPVSRSAARERSRKIAPQNHDDERGVTAVSSRHRPPGRVAIARPRAAAWARYHGRRLYVCEYTLKYMRHASAMRRHREKNALRHPPGKLPDAPAARAAAHGQATMVTRRGRALPEPFCYAACCCCPVLSCLEVRSSLSCAVRLPLSRRAPSRGNQIYHIILHYITLYDMT